MKMTYETPVAYFEMFTPNQFAGGCTPGVSEEGLEPIIQTCWNVDHNTNRSYYNLATTTTCRSTRTSNKKCEGADNSQTLIISTSSCSIKFDDSNSDLQISYIAYQNGTNRWGNPTYGAPEAVYSWSNGVGGTHSIPVSQVQGMPIDSEGRPYYFNS